MAYIKTGATLYRDAGSQVLLDLDLGSSIRVYNSWRDPGLSILNSATFAMGSEGVSASASGPTTQQKPPVFKLTTIVEILSEALRHSTLILNTESLSAN